MSMLYKVATGTAKERGYGIALARVLNFPEDILQDAERISKSLAEARQSKQETSECAKVQRRRKLMLNLQETLRHVVDSDMDDDAFRSFLVRLQAEFIAKMAEIEEDDTEKSGSGPGTVDEVTTGDGAELDLEMSVE